MKVKESSVDPDRFENTYEEWLEMAEEALSDMKAAGLKVDRALINAEELLAWCIAHNKINSAASRSEFVAHHGAKALDTDAS
ncbi:MAG: hypothetical protein HGA21_14200 [Burkholderiaceae bacterium]|nr:hypothetical protein [Burkholderiaceae bacterium]